MKTKYKHISLLIFLPYLVFFGVLGFAFSSLRPILLIMYTAERPESSDVAAGEGTGKTWSYDEAFGRNLGLISRDEQRRLREARVAIAGMGGVGGVHLMTLARLGVGHFTIADPDTFETANFNRQYGAMVRNLGRGKAEAMAEEARQVNPELDVRILPQPVTAANVGDFLEGASVVLDGLDFFALDALMPPLPAKPETAASGRSRPDQLASVGLAPL